MYRLEDSLFSLGELCRICADAIFHPETGNWNGLYDCFAFPGRATIEHNDIGGRETGKGHGHRV